jgi:hypothetical protein
MAWAANEAFAGRDFRDTAAKAATVGTLVHAAAYEFVHGRDVQWGDDPDLAAKAQRAFEAFLTWHDTTVLTVEAAEVTIISDTLQVGGRFDCLLLHGRDRIMADFKTGNSIWPSDLAQLGGYSLLWSERYPDQPISALMIIQFDRESGDLHTAHFARPFDEVHEAFLVARRLWELEGLLTKRLR